MSETGIQGDVAVCPDFLAAMQVLGKRWNGIIIQTLGEHQLRYSELKAGVIGISDAVLAARLGELTRCELVDRHFDDTGRPGGYALSQKGRELVPVLDQLTDWAQRWSLDDHLGALASINHSRSAS
ncbi:winged helix-turn-helix transcriptional regulator [Corynebacterium sp. A21]|uniref:winged helix-turn-helix transcriptional regulator n=1 Tax=Corynebacterium sp. A21 TaxID=3457318 RepID=UPI003FD5CB63